MEKPENMLIIQICFINSEKESSYDDDEKKS